MVEVSKTKIDLMCEYLLNSYNKVDEMLNRDWDDIDVPLLDYYRSTLEVCRHFLGLIYEGECCNNKTDVWIHKFRDFTTIYEKEEKK